MAKIVAIFAAFLLAWPAAAAPIEYAFKGAVTAVAAHPPGEDWGRVVTVGAALIGGYSYEINPGNPEQTINNRFWFAIEQLVRDNDNLLLMDGGKVYSEILFDPPQAEFRYSEVFHVDPAAFFFGFTNRYGWVHIDAAITDLARVVSVPAPAAILVLLAGLLMIGAAEAKTSRSSGYVKKSGTYVAPHYKTTPNKTKTDNFTSKPNVNPYTGKRGTVDPYKP